MENENTAIVTLRNLLAYHAGKLVLAEIHLKPTLQEWISEAGSLQLKTVLQKYLDFVQQHVQNLEDLTEKENIILLNISDRMMRTLIEEAKENLKYCGDTQVKDACLLASVQTINHFKISAYGTAAAFAKELGLENAADIFYEMEINEKHIDDRLSQLAEHEINKKAKTPIVLD